MCTLSTGLTRVLATVLCGVAVTACPPARRGEKAPEGRWTSAARARAVPANPDLCEDTWEAARPPGGAWDRIALHRIARCVARPIPLDTVRGPTPRALTVLYLPGRHMNGALAVLDEAYEFRLYLARRGVPVWSLDYRTHFVPPTTEDVGFMHAWTGELFLADVLAALTFVTRMSTRNVVVAGFSAGAGFAYALARHSQAGTGPGAPLGLAILDGVAPGALAMLEGRQPATGQPRAQGRPPHSAIDIGSRRLPYAQRQSLLAAVIDDPGSPSPDPGFPTVGQQLAHILYTSAAFGGRGGLSDALHGRADIRTVARLLASYDRFWPTAAIPAAELGNAGAIEHPVFAVGSTNLGDRFTQAVAASARRFGGSSATIILLSGCGHLDVLVGTEARERVFEPLLRWLNRLRSTEGSDG